MKKNGFIATSILYTFFLIFLSLFVALIANYLHNRLLISKINTDSRDKVLEINNYKLTDVKLGEHIRFAHNPGDSLINENGLWTLAYRDDFADGKVKLTFLSDLFTSNEWVNTRTKLEEIPAWHGLTIDHYEYINPSDSTRPEISGDINYYDQALLYPGFKMRIPTIDDMYKIRENPAIQNNEDVKETIFNVGGEYLIKSTSAYGDYEGNSYYVLKTYTFAPNTDVPSFKPVDNTIIQKYCNATVDGGVAKYPSANKAGYLNIVRETLKNERYANYCYYANPVPHTFTIDEGFVDKTITNATDKAQTYNLYKIRLLAEIIVDANAENIYLAGGKGSLSSPYEFVNGVKVS